MSVIFICVDKKKGLENWRKLENQNFNGLGNFDFGISLKFEKYNLDLDFEGLKIGNFEYLDFEESWNFASN